MSRVDEALRRAAQKAAQSEDDAPKTESRSAIGVDPDEFAKEPFPIEMPERPRVPSSPLSVHQPTGEPDTPVGKAPRMAAVTEPTGSRISFERLDGQLAAKVVVDQKMMPASREQYRRLAATLHHSQTDRGLKVIMIASAVVGEGKTLTAANLALTLSESYQRDVLLMDADLRRPSLNTVFGLDGASGLAEGLMSLEENKLHLHQVSSHLSILPAGKPSSDPMAGLTSDRMRRLVNEAKASFDWVIIDTPPVALLTDASLLASMVDGALLVVHAGSTPYELVKRAVEAIGGERLLGVVLNRADTKAHAYQYGYNYYGQYRIPVAEPPPQ